MVRFNNKQWTVKPPTYDRLGHLLTPAKWWPIFTIAATQIVSSVDWSGGVKSSQDPLGGIDWAAGVASPDGNNHVMGGDDSGGSVPFYPLYSHDGTALMMLDAHTFVLPNGTHYTLGPQANQLTATDRNGNQIVVGSNGWTDTLGRLIPGTGTMHPGVITTDLSTCPGGTASARVWNVPALAGGTRVFKFCYSNLPLQTTFGVPGITEYFSSGAPMLTAVVLPDLTMWTFAYNNFGDVTTLGFPTGGSISYTYTASPISCGGTPQSRWVASRTVDAHDGTGGHTWNYQYSGQITNPPGGSVYNGQTIVTSPSPDSNDTVHTISSPVPGAYCSLFDTQVKYYQGSSGTGTLLKTVTTQYSGNQNFFTSPSDGTVAANVLPLQVVSTVVQSSTVVNTWDPGTTLSNGFHVVFGSVLQRDEYDFSNTLVRSTFNHYLWQDNSTYKDNNFISLPVYSMLKTAAGCEVSKTAFGYDETYNDSNNNPVTLQLSNVGTQHVAAPGAVRGNQTSASKWLISACAEQSAITSHIIPYDTGLPYQTFDPLGRFTQYTYSSAFAGAYLTQTNLPDTQMPDTNAPIVHHIISGDYDFNTGVLTNFTDENAQQFTYTYDVMLRLTQGNHPDGGITKFLYPNVTTVERQRLISGAVYDDYKVLFDGLGRPIQTQQITPSGTVLTDTTYDVGGRAASVSNPYVQGSNHLTDPTYGLTQNQYDALSRTTRTTKQDQSFTTVTYVDNCTTATDESGKARKACSDAFGRMVTVFEDPAGLNYETDYQYDVLNNLLRVDQKGTAPTDSTKWRTRLFTYDSLSRIITALNPENATTCYGVWSGGNCINGYDSNSNLLKKTDARNITITYTYDPLNRLLDKTYSDGTQNESHRYDYASFLGQTFAYPIGREVAATAANNSIEFFTSYDTMGRVASTTQCNPGVTGCKSFTAAYDKLGNLTSLAYPGNGFTVTYSYDSNVPNSAGRLTGATDSNGITYASLDPTSSTSYWPSGAIKEFASPNFNGNKYHVDYNSRLQPVEIWTGTSPNSGALFDKQYSYGTAGTNNGNIYTITNVKDTTRTQNFTYDPLNRLLTAGDQTHWSNSYVYDAWGNLYQKNPGTLPGEGMSSVPDTNNHLSGLTYDAGGNVTNDGLGGTFTFDAENRIKTAGSVTYTYDADGRRIQKSTGINYWYGPGGQVMAETDSVGNWTNYIFFGGQRLARNVPQTPPAQADIKYYITDHLHSTGMFVDKAGTVAAIQDDNDFYPWGGVVPGVGKTSSDNTVKFTGQYRDTDTAANLDYFGARYYSNTIGRFMSPDWAAKPTTVPYGKFGDPQSLNLYSYVENAPINRSDPDGHFDDPFGVLSGGADTGMSNIQSSHTLHYDITVTATATTTKLTWSNGSTTSFTSYSDPEVTDVSLSTGDGDSSQEPAQLVRWKHDAMVVHDDKPGSLPGICFSCYGAVQNYYYTIADSKGGPFLDEAFFTEHVRVLEPKGAKTTVAPEHPVHGAVGDMIGHGQSTPVKSFHLKTEQTFSIRYKGKEYWLSTIVNQIIDKSPKSGWSIRADIVRP